MGASIIETAKELGVFQIGNLKEPRLEVVNLDLCLDNHGLKVKLNDRKIYQEYAHCVDACERWLSTFCEPRDRLNKIMPSSYLATSVSSWVDYTVSNAAFIQAAINLGYKYKSVPFIRYDFSENAYFYMSIPRKRSSLWTKACLPTRL